MRRHIIAKAKAPVAPTQKDAEGQMKPTHFGSFDSRFCGAEGEGRKFITDLAEVTCEDCMNNDRLYLTPQGQQMVREIEAGSRYINARYRLEITRVPWTSPSPEPPQFNYDVIDKARELQFLDGVIFSNGTEQECRDWVLRNREEPGEHTKGDWQVIPGQDGTSWDVSPLELSDGEQGYGMLLKPDACLIATSPRLLALLEQYHQIFPSKESGKLICQARGWEI